MDKSKPTTTTFSFKKTKPQRKVLTNVLGSKNSEVKERAKEMILGLSGTRVKLENNSEKAQVRVVPVCLNPWQTKAKEKSSKTPEEADAAQKRAAAKALLKAANNDGDDDENGDDEQRIIELNVKTGNKSQLELVMEHKKAFDTDESGTKLSNADKLKRELNMRPEEQNFRGDSYEIHSIEGFGKAVLMGMGWDPSKDKVKAAAVMPRPHRVGLGAMQKPWEMKKQKERDGKKKAKKGKHFVIEEGAVVGIIGSVYEGDKGKITALIAGSVSVFLENEQRVVDLPRKFVRLLSSPSDVSTFQKEHKLARPKRPRQPEVEEKRDSGESAPAPKKKRKSHKKKKSEKKQSRKERSTVPTPMWLVPCARVRVISKRRLPQYYNKVGTIILIADPVNKECHVRLDSGTVIENIKQRYLQTEVPRKKGANVIAVAQGDLHGRRGRMLDFSTKTGIGAIQMQDTMIVHKLDQDDFAAFAHE